MNERRFSREVAGRKLACFAAAFSFALLLLCLFLRQPAVGLIAAAVSAAICFAVLWSFTDFGSVEARADGDVEYWIVNGIRVTPNENVTSVRLQHITSDILISAVLPAPEEAVLDSGDRVQVTCVGCRFTYMADNLVSVTSGSVPRGADIIVMADAKAAEGGYSVNGGEYVRQGKVSFRLTVTENTEIKTK